MLTVHEVSERTGVSVRALHHYDAIGLLKPALVTEAGYRLYDDGSLKRLQSILLYKELRFSLGEIREMLARPGFDAGEALRQQAELLELEKARLDRLITLARDLSEGRERAMDFTPYSRKDIEGFKEEAKARWGATDAYREYETRGRGAEAAEGLMERIGEIAALRELPPDSEETGMAVAGLQSYITENYYNCTDEILAGLGQMYAGDERFRKNIDASCGEGSAGYVARAIEAYCGKRR